MSTRRKPKDSEAAEFLQYQTRLQLGDRLALIESIRSGLPFQAVIDAVTSLALTIKDLATYGVIPARTLSHSKRSGRFTQAQSDRVARFIRVWLKARETFGNPAKGRKWMERPTRPLGDRAPVALLDTEEGARLVEDLLFRIDHGLSS